MALMSLSSASVTTSASSPSITARACLPDPPCDCWMVTVSPVSAFHLAAKASLNCLVELAGRIVGNVEDGRVGECEAENAELHGAGEEAGKEFGS